MVFKAVGIASLVLAVLLGVPVATGAQEASGYEPLVLPDGWDKLDYKDSEGIGRVEYIYNDRADALLKIKKVAVQAGETPGIVAERDLEKTLRFLPNYVRGKSEAFTGGNQAGVFAQFDFTRSGKPMLGRNYYVKGDGTTVWVLQFTGARKTLGPMRNMTDQIARAFKVQ